MGMRMIPFLYRVGSGASGDKKKIFGIGRHDCTFIRQVMSCLFFGV